MQKEKLKRDPVMILVCPVCNGSDHSDFLTAKDHMVSGETFTLKKCNECGMIRTDPVPADQDLPKYYESEEYLSHKNEKSGIFPRIYDWVRNYAVKGKCKYVIKNSNLGSGKVLDIGCGIGYFLNGMRSAGWEAEGIEPSDNARAVAKSEFEFDLKNGNEVYNLDRSSFDVITMWHSLEHVNDLDGYLKQINKALRNNGTLVIALPNHTSFDAKYYKEFWAAYDVPRHLHHFSRSSIQRLLKNYGFKLKDKKGMPFDPFYVSILSEKYKNGSSLKALFIGLISLFISLFNTEKASSIIYIFKKLPN